MAYFQDLMNRIGILRFTQTILMCWNVVFIFIMIISMIHGVRRDKEAAHIKNLPELFTPELTFFFTSLMFYDLFDVLCVTMEGDLSPHGLLLRRVAEFGYCLIGIFQMLFFLQVVKKHVAKINNFDVLSQLLNLMQVLNSLVIIVLISTPFTGALYYFDEKNYYQRGQWFNLWTIITFTSFILIITTSIYNRKRIQPYIKNMMLIGSIVPTIAFLLNINYTGISFHNIFVSFTAVLLYLHYSRYKTFTLIKRTQELERAKVQLSESRLALEESKNEVLMAQIQPHFINNSLMAIRAQCTNYPEVYESITNFSRYLRSNFEALGDTRLITFEQEMLTVEAYLSLERANYGDLLKTEYDIDCDDFLVPALSVQPLVENAVRHGVGTFDEGGTVKISAHRSNGIVTIQITNKCSGKSSMTEKQKTRRGIGIDNVRKRLGSMSDGKLDVVITETGATATVTIPDTKDDGKGNIKTVKPVNDPRPEDVSKRETEDYI